MAARKVKLEIGGSSYVVSTNDPEDYLLGLAARLDADMNKLMIETPNASVTAAAVITALGYLDEAEKSAFGADNMRAQIQDYLEDAARARMAAEEAKREAERLRRELAHYEKKAPKGKPPETRPEEMPVETVPPAPADPAGVAPPADPAGFAAPAAPADQMPGQMGLEEY